VQFTDKITCPGTFRQHEYINGKFIGTQEGYKKANVFSGELAPSQNVFSILATNDKSDQPKNPAGVILAIYIKYSDNSTEVLRSSGDGSWLASEDVSSVTRPAVNDSAWKTAAALADVGEGPWGFDVDVNLLVRTLFRLF
jgi:hypothetical protein